MPPRVVRFEDTPNPNAVKCWLDAPIAGPPRSYFSATEASDSERGTPLAAALFAVPGVTNLLFMGEWMTVSKAASADWKAVKAGVHQALKALR